MADDFGYHIDHHGSLVRPASLLAARAGLSGDALARMVRHKRPSVKAVFVGQPESSRYVEGAGEFLAHPVDLQALVDTVARYVTESD